ncbi:S-adenosyl-L-methionine-dependent methyltransferase [Leptodontidium sp. 2 PMI_412]|nr:S-adenosyl-L-methionine-dependent methyltransferase [Leptodontidium sp. 2 PMI_412]
MSTNNDGAALPIGAIPIDENQAEDDGDSSYGDESNRSINSTGSITESILEYREVHGRTFQNFKTTEYWAPNDEQQNEQLDIGHHMMTLLLDGKLFVAPIGPNPQKVIDIGTGTGIWAIDFADQFPSAEVIGTDLSPIQPTWVPPNLKFELDDAQLEWTYQPDSFDFVHLRTLQGSIGDWPAIYAQAFRCIKPGGWIQDMEMSIMWKSDDGTVTDDHLLNEWSRVSIEAAKKIGKTFENAQFTKENMIKAGFVDVVEKKYKMPLGGWSSDPKLKEIGRWNALYFQEGIEGMCLYLLNVVMGWTYEEVQVYMAKLRSALFGRKLHPYYEIYVVYGQKPET